MRIWLLLTLVTGACQVTSTIPGDALIDCDSNADCPEGQICSQSLERCIRRGSDETAPTIQTITVRVVGRDPALRKVVGVGGEVEIDVTVDERLGKDPEVKLVWLTSSRDAVEASTSDLTWTYSYTIQPGDEHGFATVEVEVVDEVGLTSSDELPAVLEVDLVAPELIEPAVGITYLPDPAGRLLTVNAATDGTTVHLTMLANEPLSEPPLVFVQPPTAPRMQITEDDLVAAETEGNLYTFELAPGSWPEDGPYAVEVTLTDEAGNSDTYTPTRLEFEVDTIPPPTSPDVDDAGAIVLSRTPWGSEATFDSGTGAAPSILTVAGATNSAPANTTLIVLDGPGATAAEVGRTAVRASGSFGTPASAANPIDAEPTGPLVLPRSDIDSIWLIAVDGAGNATAPVEVRNGTWTATLVGRVPGQDEANPNRLWLQSNTPTTPFSILRREPSPTDLTDTMLPDAVAAGFSAARQWQPRRSDAPMGGVFSSMTYADSRGETMLFGGFRGPLDPFAYLWNGSEWQRIAVPGLAPTPRAGHTMAYDSLRDRVIVFSGSTGLSLPFTDVWEWTGTRWLDRTPPVAGPTGRFIASMAFDAARGRTVLFGGIGAADAAGDCPDGNPAPLSGFCFYTDTWEWDGNGWIERCQSTECPDVPGGRIGASLTYDPNTGESILFGGCAIDLPGTLACDEPLGDTWAWDGSTWQERTPTVSPPARVMHQAVYADAAASDAPVGRVVLFGGCEGPAWSECSLTRNDLWTWDPLNQTWEKIAPAGLWPQPRATHALAYDRLRDELILLGGTARRPTNPGCGEPAAEESDSGTTDCQYLDTWIWKRGAGWTAVAAVTASPIGRRSASMAFDPSTERSVLFGGRAEIADCGSGTDACDDLWEWDGRAWAERCTTSPCLDDRPVARSEAPMVAIGGGRVALYGGLGVDSCILESADGCNDLWVWDSSAAGTWTKWTTVNGPPGRSSTALAFDSTRGAEGTLVLFGGLVDAVSCPTYSVGATGDPTRCVLCDTWELDLESGTWQQRAVDANDCAPTSVHPSPRRAHGMIFDPIRGVTVLYGGCSPEDPQDTCDLDKLDDTWTWDGTTWTEVEPSAPPGPRSEPRMVFDTWRGRTLLDGGRLGNLTFPSWDWTGSTWQPIYLGTVLPPQSDGHSIAYDDSRRVMVLITDALDLWELDLDPRLAPSAIFEVAFGHANRSGSGPGPGDVVAIEVDVAAEGRGFHDHDPAMEPVSPAVDASPRRGTRLQAWNVTEQEWQSAADNCSDAPGDPAAIRRITATLTNPQSYVLGTPPKILVRVVPCFGSGSSAVPSALDLDYLEATVSYRLP